MSSGKSHEAGKKTSFFLEFTLINNLICLFSWGLQGIWKGHSLHVLSPSAPQGISASLPLSVIGALSPPPSFPAPFALQGSCSRAQRETVLCELPPIWPCTNPPSHTRSCREGRNYGCGRDASQSSSVCYPRYVRQLKGAKESRWTVLPLSSPFFATSAELPSILNLQVKIFFLGGVLGLGDSLQPSFPSTYNVKVLSTGF